MRNLRFLIVAGVIILGLALVSTALAAISHTRQAVFESQLAKPFIANSNQNLAERQPGAYLFTAYSPGRYQAPIPSQPTTYPYTPSLPRPASIDWQALEDGSLRPASQSVLPEGVWSDFGMWDSNMVNAPTIMRVEDIFWMWYTGMAWDNSYGMGQAITEDGIHWTKSESNPFFTQAAEPGFIALAPDDYRLYYSDWDEGTIYLRESHDGGETWLDPALMLSPSSDPEDWDAAFVSDPVVLYVAGTYYMFYEGGGGDPMSVAIGLAMSPDGIAWTRVGGDPILVPGDPDDWDEMWVLDPMVIEDGGDWQMWFRGMNNDGQRAIGYATSSNGILWAKHGDNPVFTADPTGWDTGGPSGMWVEHFDDLYHMWYASNRQIGYASSEDGIDWQRPLEDAVLKPSPMLYLELNVTHNWVHAYTLPNEPVTVTLKDSEDQVLYSVVGKANDWGDFWSGDWINELQIQPYESLFVEAAGLAEEIDPIGEILGEIELDNDLVTGSLNAPWLGEDVQMSCDLWSEPYVSIDLGMVPVDGGTFECDFGAEGVDLQPGMLVALVYHEPDGDLVINVVESPWMRVNVAHDWVGGNYPAGHTFNITVKDSADNIKATAIAQSDPYWGWGGDGFETQWDQWTPSQPDIQPGDKVLFASDDGFSDTVLVGDIQGDLDIATDSITGPIYATWYTQDLDVECHPWGAPGPTDSKSSIAGADGDPPYTCDWSGEWDILPGQDVAVMYIQPDNGDRVINVFREPAPDVAIGKWVEGSGLVQPGGTMIFNIWYGNQGEERAKTVRITDTLPANTSYVMDTSGTTAFTTTNTVSWEFQNLDPGEGGWFQVVLVNQAEVGEILGNNVEIYALNDMDESNNYAYAEVEVFDGDYNLYVNKHPTPSDPTPGETYKYYIDYGNQDAVSSGAITLTETLPEGTSLVGWASNNQFELLTELSYDNGVLVLTAPSLPGYWGDTLRLTLEVDPDLEYGTQLTNTVEITTPGDIDPWNDWHLNADAWVNPPRLDGAIVKGIPWGQIYPGGELVYPITFYNDGNISYDAVVTDYLPAGMSFVNVHAWKYGIEFPLIPAYVDGEMVVIEYDDLAPGEWVDFDLVLAIDPGFEAGTTALNCVELDTGGADGSPYNNSSCLEYLIPEAGSNLRLVKRYWWNGDNQLQYQLDIQNIGSEPLDNFWISDLLADRTSWNGSWWVNYGGWITATGEAGGDQLAFWVDYMDPGDNASVGYQADLDGDIVGDLGMVFTNLAEAPIDGDVYPEDNIASVTAFTGADVFAKKWLSAGEPLPGEVITYTVMFGNLNVSPWDGDMNFGSHVVDTLPDGVTFLYATAPWNANEIWEPESVEDNVVSWGWGPMWSDSFWRTDIVVQLDEDLPDGAVLINSIEAHSDNPHAYDFDWSNNFDEVTSIIDLYPYEYYLPMNFKLYIAP